MISFKKKITITFFLFFLLFTQNSFSEDRNVLEILEIIQKDLKTLEKAVYSDSNSTISNSTIEFDENTEDVLTRHLLKLSEIEGQFKELTNKFESINFKLDKLSSRLSKVQADNQMRFQQLEDSKELVLKPKEAKLYQDLQNHKT
jgi:TolA-binding protein